MLGDIEHQHEHETTHHQLSLTAQTLRLREDFTGFLLDQQTPFQQPHDQRGDLIDLESDAITAQAQGWMREKREAFGQPQQLELGYFARLDRTSGQQYRIEAGTGHPYREATPISTPRSATHRVVRGGSTSKLATWIALRGGVRADLFAYDVLDNCAVHDVAHPSNSDPPGDASCLSQEDFGHYREPVQRATTSSMVVLPRASLVLGPFEGWSPSLSYGDGVRSIDPSYISQDVRTPFARIRSYDAGAAYKGELGGIDTTLKLSGFRTHVDHDLVFSETEGRNVLANGTTRLGAAISGRATGAWFDELASATLVRSTFDDTGLLIPYVPDVVVRSDTVVFGDVYGVRATGGVGVTFVGPRALPYGERSDTIFTIDAQVSAGWSRYKLGLEAQNLLDTHYRLGEYNYASDFHSQAEPTLTISRELTAGAPRTLLLRLEVGL